MDYLEAVKVLRGIPLFSKLDSSKLKLLAFASQYLTYDDGEALFHVGDTADCAYLIDEGEAVILAENEDREIEVGVLGRHEIFGEMAIFRSSPRIATIRAKGCLKVMRIEGDMFLSMVTENPDVALEVMRALSDKIALALESYEKMDEKVRALQSVSGTSGKAP
ncbi:MAG: Crp/Fnr family transcriptional regulator [Rhodospirillales bacterium]